MENWPDSTKCLILLAEAIAFLLLYIITYAAWGTYLKYDKQRGDLIFFIAWSALLITFAAILILTIFKFY